MRIKLIALVLSSLAVVLAPPTASGQRGVTDAITPPAVEPGSNAGSFVLSGFESVNAFSGKLSFGLPLFSFGGRGEAGYSAVLPLDRSWQIQAQLDGNGNPVSHFAVTNLHARGHWWSDLAPPLFSPGRLVSRRSGSDLVACEGISGTSYYQSTLTRLTFVGSDGSETELVDAPSGGRAALWGSTCDPATPIRPGPYVSRDGTAMTFVPSVEITEHRDPNPGYDQGAPSGTLYFRDGRKYLITYGVVSQITDRHGNRTVITYDSSQSVTSITDPLGREFTVGYDALENADVLTWKRIPGQPSHDRKLKVKYGPLASSLFPSSATPKTFTELFGAWGGSSTVFNPIVVSSVELPDQRSYSFRYNEYGELAQVLLPTEGGFRYEWVGAGVYNAGKPFIVRRVTRRTVIDENSTEVSRVDFAYESGPLSVAGNPYNYHYTKVTETPVGIGASGKTVRYFYGSPTADTAGTPIAHDIPASYWRDGREYIAEEFKDASSKARTTVTAWEQRACDPGETCVQPTGIVPAGYVKLDPRATARTVTLNETDQATEVVTVFDRFNNETQVSEYDKAAGGSTTLLRQVTTTYESDATYTNPPAHLRSLPASTMLRNGASAIISQSEFVYDEGTLLDDGISTLPGYQAPSSGTPRGNLTKTRDWLSVPTVPPSIRWLETTRTYDLAGNLRSTTDPRSLSTTAEYTSATAFAFPTLITNPLSQETAITWDILLGRPLTVQGPNAGESTTYTYDHLADKLDRLTSVSHNGGSTTVYEYNDTLRTRTTKIAQSSGLCASTPEQESTAVFDGLGRQVRSILREGIVNEVESEIKTDTLYDAMGRPWKVSFPYRSAPGAWTERVFDGIGRLTVETVAGAATTFTYNGRATLITDPADKKRSHLSDALGRLQQVTEGPGVSGFGFLTAYSYDAADRLLSVAQAGQSRSFSYDSLGRLLSANNPEAGVIQYRYDDSGNLVQRTDARGIKTCTGFQSGTDCTDASGARDGLNRITKKSYTGEPAGSVTPAVTYTYDACPHGAGRLCSVTVAGGSSLSYTYDVAGRIVTSTQVTGGTSYPFAYAYNQAGLLERTTLPSGRSVTQCYDKAGRVKSVEGAKPGGQPHAYLSQAAYHEGGGLQQALLGNGRWEGWDYNTRMQPTQVKLGTTQGAADLLSLTFGYGPAANNNGNILSQTITRPGFSATQTHAYDALNRIANIVEAVDNRHFGYSATGNMWVTTTSTAWAPTSFTPRSAEWFNAATNRLVNASLQITHDNAGHLTKIGTHNYAYDAEGRLKTSTINTATTTFEYDGEGRRVKKGNETYVYDAFGNLAAEYGGTVSTTGTQYLTTDHLGSTRLITNSANPAEPRCLDYFPFGEEIPRPSVACYTPTTEPRQKFTGKERDTETDLDYFGARYYSAPQGRFTSPDPGNAGAFAPDPQTWNMYAYALNNPYKFVDPNGEAALLATAAGGAGIGFVIGAAKEAWHAHGSGSDFGSINTWRNIGAKGAGGAVFGFGIGLTGGLGLVPTTLVSGTASLAGGALERSLDADEATQPGDLTEIVSDAAGGIVGGGVGFGAQALLRARINYPEYFRVLQRQISRAKRVAGNTLRPSRHAARLEQVRRLQSDHELMTVWWGRITVQWPAAVARSGSKTATKAVVTVTISFLTEDEEGSR